MTHSISMGMQCGPVEGLSDSYTAGVFVYNTGMRQLLIHLREKTLQEGQQALFLECHSKGITRLLIVVFIMVASAKEKKAAHRPI